MVRFDERSSLCGVALATCGKRGKKGNGGGILFQRKALLLKYVPGGGGERGLRWRRGTADGWRGGEGRPGQFVSRRFLFRLLMTMNDEICSE